MHALQLTDEQVIALVQQLPEEQRKRVLARLLQAPHSKPRPMFGRGKEHIRYIAEDFDAPVDDCKNYM